MFLRVRHREFTFQWACGIELRLRAIDLLSFCRDVIFLTRVGFFSCSIKIRCCLAPSYLKKCLVHLHFRLRAKVITITAKKVDQTAFLKSRCSKQAYTIALESVLTEEEAAEYLEQLAFEEEEEQILRSCFFFRRGRHHRLLCFPCYEIQSFHNKNRENKTYDRMCLLSFNSSTSEQTASHQRIKSCLFIDNKYFCLAFLSNFLENQNCPHFFLKIYRFSV